VYKIILLVKDDPDDEILTLRAVREHITEPVVVVRDDSEALDFLFGSGDYEGRDLSITTNLILLDLKLPKLNGFKVLRRIRGDARTMCIPVVILSSSAEEQEILDCYSLGANSYLCKPQDFSKFCDTLKQVMAYWLHLNQLPRQWQPKIQATPLEVAGYDVSVRLRLPKQPPHATIPPEAPHLSQPCADTKLPTTEQKPGSNMQ
jgi:two-component system, response regulator